MDIINILFSWNWCGDPATNPNSLAPIFQVIKRVLEVIRIIVPIILIVMTSVDITKKVINPDEKDGQKKIMIRVIAAVIVFFIPTMIKITFKLIDLGMDNGQNAYQSSETGLSACWR